MRSWKKAASLFLLIAAGLMPQANAADDTEFRHSGEMRMRYFNDLNSSGVAASDQRADTAMRFKYGVAARKGETLQAYVRVIHNSLLGSQNTQTGEFGNVGVPLPAGAPPQNLEAATQNVLIVNRAWGLWKANESLSFRVGRFGINVADGAVFSENDWQPVPTAHEGLEVAVDTDFAKISAFFTKTNELSLPPVSETGRPSSDPERNLYILTADLKNLPDAVKTANAHFVYITRDRTEPPASPTATQFLNGSQTIQHVGVTLGGELSGFIYKATGVLQMGIFSRTEFEQQISASMVDALVGYTNTDVSNIRITAGFHSDSGNSAGYNSATSEKNERYQPMFYERHDYAGLLDLLNWGNLTYWNAEASFYPAENFELGARFYMFSQSRAADPDGPAFGPRHAALYGPQGFALGERSLGNELDAYGTKYYDGGFKVHARMSGFFPGDYFKNGTIKRDKPIVQLMFQGAFEF